MLSRRMKLERRSSSLLTFHLLLLFLRFDCACGYQGFERHTLDEDNRAQTRTSLPAGNFARSEPPHDRARSDAASIEVITSGDAGGAACFFTATSCRKLDSPIVQPLPPKSS